MNKKVYKLSIAKISKQSFNKTLSDVDLNNIYFVLCGMSDFQENLIDEDMIEYCIQTYFNNI